jgi:hypothetical protein
MDPGTAQPVMSKQAEIAAATAPQTARGTGIAGSIKA